MVEVNGQQYQHATTKAMATGTGGVFSFKTHKKISYKVKVPKKLTNDYQGQVDGFTFDKEDVEASLTIKLSEYYALRVFLFGQNPGMGLMQCQFDMPVSYGGKINALKTDILRFVMIQEEPRESEDGQDALMVELPLLFMPSASTFADGPPMIYEP